MEVSVHILKPRSVEQSALPAEFISIAFNQKLADFVTCVQFALIIKLNA